MALDAFELVELRKLERGGLVGSDGRNWLRIVIGVTLPLPLMLGGGYLYERVVPVLIVALVGIAATSMWTVHAGRKMVHKRVVDLRARA